MFVNPTGALIAQLLKDRKITDWTELLIYAVWGAGLGPAAHVWNNILQHFTDKYGWNLLVKLFVDHLLWKESVILIFCCYTQLVRGETLAKVWEWSKQNFFRFPGGLFFSSWYVWTPIQLINLRWVPLPYRVLYMNISVCIWTIYLANKLAADKAKKLLATESKKSE
eukprot:SAG22_NODE_1305_length_4793_cov_3.652961_2_plen_167_part_00